MKYAFRYEAPFEATDASAACEHLWKTQKFAVHDTLESWMQAQADACDVAASMAPGGQGQATTRRDTPENLVADMLRLGILRVIG